ncbi:MAG TPA: ABC transporter ATP-binding protein [Verrucomicrobiae bacterium]|nr:ABC transporter ATP-binding protein [Verrucomicrobiae bacterium]
MSKETLIELKGVKKRYGPAGDVLRGIDLRVEPGQTIAIVGPSGSGKSTLLNIIGAIDSPDSGSVRIRDKDPTTMSEPDLAAMRARDFGWIFQAHHLIPHCTVLENALLPTLAIGDRRAGAAFVDRARALLDRVGIASLADRRPGQLSSGECQRAAAVRALINGPRVLLADEPTGALDAANAAAMIELLLELHRDAGAALILVTHAPPIAARMGRILELSNGRLSAKGEP